MSTNTLAIVRSLGACPHCGYGNAAPDGRLTVTCAGPSCGRKITLKRIRAVYTDARDCDDRCLYAVGNSCACNCGGENHGGGYSPGTLVAEVPEWVRVRDRKRHADQVTRRTNARQAKIAKLHAEIDALINEHPALSILIDDQHTLTDEARSNGFYESIAGQLIKNGFLSDKQVEAIERSVIRQRERAERQAEREIEAAELIKAGVKVPTGRLTITGTVVFVKIDEYDPWGQPYKFKIQSDAGWQVYGSVPASLRQARPADAPPLKEWLTGKRVEITAAIKPKDGDQLFGYISRPTKAKIIA